MVDTPRTITALATTLFQDGQAPGAITAQRIRDLVATFAVRTVASVTQYAATGDGVTDDTAALTAAVAATPTGGTLEVPAGVYLVTGITINKSMRLRLRDGATIKLKNAANASAISVTASDVTISGGKIDGNKANQTGNSSGISAAVVDRVTIDGVAIDSTLQYGIRLQDGDDLIVRNCRVTATGDTGIQFFCTTKTVNRATAFGNVVDRSDDAAYAQGCIKMSNNSGGATFGFYNSRMSENRVKMHSAPTGSGVAALEVWAGGVLANKSCSISNNDVEGAALGISLADCANGLVEGNSVRNFLSYGLEMPGGLNGGIVGNSVDGQNNAVGQDGILVDGNAPSVNRIVGNSIVNLSGRAIYTTGSNIVVSGNTIANCSGIGVEINGGDFVSITGNLVDVTAGATGQGVWVIESSSVSVSGNIVRAGASANAIQCVALTGATRNHIVVIGNFASGSNDILMTGSHFGDDIIIGPNNNGLGGYIAIDFANLLFVEFSSNDPNSFAPWVGIGSIFLRKGGAVGQQLAVKQATAGPSWAYVNMTQRIEVTITAAQLAAAAKPVLVAALATARWKVRSIKLTGITGLSGGGGDRNVRIQDNSGTTIWSTLTAAAVQGTTPLRWGDAGAPFASGAALTAESVAGEALVATYAAGTTDYTAGSITLIVEYERTT